MNRFLQLLAAVAPAALPVLLVGETGVGKDVMATELHRRSRRAMGPFVTLSCAAIPERLLESELFGYEHGASNDGGQPKGGLFESADGGTLFLDEIGELPASMQVKLLRVLETNEVLRLGGHAPRKVDVRIVAATNHDLPALVAEGRFRGDLYFRLNGITLTLPPLRERKDQIHPLARHFAEEASSELGRPAPELSPGALERLESHEWPGNVRELRNVVRRAVILSEGRPVEEADLLLEGWPSSSKAPTAPPPSSEATALGESGLDAQDARILAVLRAFGGNQTRAARELGVARGTLIRRLERLNVPRPKKKD